MTTAADLHRKNVGIAGPTVAELVERCGKWSVATFGPTPEGSPVQELRLLKEVVELCFAAGASEFDISNAVGLEVFRSGGKFLTANRRSRGYREGSPDPAKVPEEYADAQVVLAQGAYRRAINLGGETLTKQDRNERRTWDVGPDGVGQHRDEPSPGPAAAPAPAGPDSPEGGHHA